MSTVIVMGHGWAGIYRNLEKLLNSSYILQQAVTLELHLDSVAVDLTVISLWPSVESRLKIQEIITVRVSTIQTVKMCSHSDKESYKNLRQSESQWLHWYSWEILQLLINTIIHNTDQWTNTNNTISSQ